MRAALTAPCGPRWGGRAMLVVCGGRHVWDVAASLAVQQLGACDN